MANCWNTGALTSTAPPPDTHIYTHRHITPEHVNMLPSLGVANLLSGCITVMCHRTGYSNHDGEEEVIYKYIININKLYKYITKYDFDHKPEY